MRVVTAEAPGLDRSPDNNPKNYRNPLEQKMPYEDLNITTEDGVSLHGWFVPHDNRKTARTVVYYHENAGSTEMLSSRHRHQNQSAEGVPFSRQG